MLTLPLMHFINECGYRTDFYPQYLKHLMSSDLYAQWKLLKLIRGEPLPC